jgi:hypothetical protein
MPSPGSKENSTVKSRCGHSTLFVLCSLFFLLSLAGIVALIASDLHHSFKDSLIHERLDAWPLMMIGVSYITLQFAIKQDLHERLKGIFLGIAFLCWGAEQLLPPSRLVTILDECAVTIFVVDVSVIIWGHLNKAERTNLPL